MLSVTLLALAQLPGQTATARGAKSVSISIQGRVLAAIDSPFHGVGLGPKYESFIFGWEQAKGQMRPVKILYAYFKYALPASFYDYTTRYELAAVRDTSCDETVGSLSLIKNVTTSGRELPPTNVLRPLKGAPEVLLKPETELPCYIVKGKFKSLSSEKGCFWGCGPDLAKQRAKGSTRPESGWKVSLIEGACRFYDKST